MPETLSNLRKETAEIHSDLHSHPALQPLHTDRLTLDAYKNALRGFYGFYCPMEAALKDFHHPEIETLKISPKLTNLQSDLQRHEIDVSSPDYMPLPERLDLNRAVAYLYLREGSALGGLQISKTLEQVLGLKPGTDNKFFYGAGKEGVHAWKRYLALVDNLDRLKLLEPSAVSSYAKQLFSNLYDWMLKYV